jgi:hypothetical protein
VQSAVYGTEVLFDDLGSVGWQTRISTFEAPRAASTALNLQITAGGVLGELVEFKIDNVVITPVWMIYDELDATPMEWF